ncbi:class I adenylate-forming enzyme family protein [Rhodococcus sp. 06-235-1A]|uniref:class I adenylate-forming enzyme family protein n=1 Tax=Rhodococcus sp. 06-235-1A TaxID=2022508 RepID=UPI001C528227|nr:fatty acid--CoA ligase family protein [Rhodococcus sp. 06-235-1A]
MNFAKMLRSNGNADALVIDDTVFTYNDLADTVDRWSEFYRREGVTDTSVVGLRGHYSADLCGAFISLYDLGAVIVPFSPDTPAEKLQSFTEVAQLSTLHDLGTSDITHLSASTDSPHRFYEQLRTAHHAGLVLFSSGTTGRSKGSVLDLSKLVARYGDRRRARRTLAFMQLDHIGGVNTILHTLSLGGSVVTISGERTPDDVFSTVQSRGVDTLPVTPTFLTMSVVAGAVERYDLSSLKLITYGTEPMPVSTLSRVTELLPDVTLKQTYGLSELGIIPTRSKDDGSLWMKLGTDGFEYDIRDDVLWVRADTAMLGYLNAPNPFDEHGYFNTQDKVEVDGDYVRILGRDSDIINVGGEKVYPAEVESAILEVDDVREVIVCGRPSPIMGHVVVASVQAEAGTGGPELEQRILHHCNSTLEPYKVPMLIEFIDGRYVSERFKKLRSL